MSKKAKKKKPQATPKIFQLDFTREQIDVIKDFALGSIDLNCASLNSKLWHKDDVDYTLKDISDAYDIYLKLQEALKDE